MVRAAAATMPHGGGERGCPEERPLPWGGAARDANEPKVPPGGDLSPQVERLAVVGEE